MRIAELISSWIISFVLTLSLPLAFLVPIFREGSAVAFFGLLIIGLFGLICLLNMYKETFGRLV